MLMLFIILKIKVKIKNEMLFYLLDLLKIKYSGDEDACK